MTSTSHDVNGNDVKNGNDVGVKMVIPQYLKMLYQKQDL